MVKITTFEGDLTNQETVRAKLADVEAKIEQRERLRERVEEDLERLERVKEGLLVIVGDKEAESGQAQVERLEKEAKSSAAFRAMWERGREHKQAGATIQAQVEHVVNALEGPVTANDVLDCLPVGTPREAVNYALWRAADQKRLRRISHGVYASIDTSKASTTGGR